MRTTVIMGLELELGLLNAPELTTRRDRACASLLATVAGMMPHAPGLYPKQQHAVFLANGAAFGLEPPGWLVPEYDTPECASPFELAAAVAAGMRLLGAAAAQVDVEWSREAGVRRGPRGPLRFVAASDFYQRDHRSLGHHECYGIRAPAGMQGDLHRAILPWLVYRQLLTEPGFLSAENGTPVGFGLSPRARHLVTTCGPATTAQRAMITSSRTSHAGRGWLRLHVIAAGATVSPWAIAVRHGVTALLLGMARRGWQPHAGIYPRDPVRALRSLTADPDHPCRTVATTTITARAALAELLAAARRAHGEEPLAPWADRILGEWERGLALAGKSGAPAPGNSVPASDDGGDAALYLEHVLRRRLLGGLLAEAGVTEREFHFWFRFLHHVDAFRRNGAAALPHAASGEVLRALVLPERLPALDAMLAAGSVSWSDLPPKRRLIERMCSADIELSCVAGGIADRQSRLRAARGAEVVSEEEVARALYQPPAGTRAAARAVLIRQHAGDRSLRATWNEVQCAGRRHRMPSPLSNRPVRTRAVSQAGVLPRDRGDLGDLGDLGAIPEPRDPRPHADAPRRSPAGAAWRAHRQCQRERRLYGVTSPLGPLFAGLREEPPAGDADP